MSVISGLATEIFQTEFDGNTGIMPRSYIEAWLISNLGLLNTHLNTSYSGVDASLDLESQAIYKLLYLSNFYRKESRKALRGLISETGGANILSLKDGNSAVSFVNRNEISKTFKSLADKIDEDITVLTHKYNIYSSAPLQLGGVDAYGGVISPIFPEYPMNQN